MIFSIKSKFDNRFFIYVFVQLVNLKLFCLFCQFSQFCLWVLPVLLVLKIETETISRSQLEQNTTRNRQILAKLKKVWIHLAFFKTYKIKTTVYKITHEKGNGVKYKRFKKIVWIWSHHLQFQWKFNLRAGKFTWCDKAKHCWVMSTNFFIFKSLLTTPQANFPAHNFNFHWRWRWWGWIQDTF